MATQRYRRARRTGCAHPARRFPRRVQRLRRACAAALKQTRCALRSHVRPGLRAPKLCLRSYAASRAALAAVHSIVRGSAGARTPLSTSRRRL